MMKLLRSQSQIVLALVLAFIAVGFLFYGNAGNLLYTSGARTSNDYGRINGEDITVGDLYDTIRSTKNMLRVFGQAEKLQQPGAQAAVAGLAWQQLLLLHEADRLHIYVGPGEIADWIRKVPAFQKNGAFSLDAYNAQMKQLQVFLHVTPEAGADPLATTRSVFENVIRDFLRTEAVKNALFDSVRSSAHDVSEQYQQVYGPTTVTYVTFDPKTFAANLHVAPADIEAEYKNNPTTPAYRTAEKRNVDYDPFLLSPEQLKLPEDQKQAAKDALGQKALDFALAFQPNPSAEPGTPAPVVDFQAEAKKRNLTPVATDFFTAEQAPSGLPPSPAFNSAAFALTKDASISKVVDMADGVAVLHLSEIQPSQLRPLDEVKADIEKHLLQTQSLQSARINAQLMSKLLQAAVDKGGTFAAAATAMKLKPETPAAFVPSEVVNDPKLGVFAYQALQLKPGQTSEPFALSGGDTLAVLHVDSRAQAAPAGLADFDKRFRTQQDEQLRNLVLGDWVRWKSKQPGTHAPPDLPAYGAVE